MRTDNLTDSLKLTHYKWTKNMLRAENSKDIIKSYAKHRIILLSVLVVIWSYRYVCAYINRQIFCLKVRWMLFKLDGRSLLRQARKALTFGIS